MESNLLEYLLFIIRLLVFEQTLAKIDKNF